MTLRSDRQLPPASPFLRLLAAKHPGCPDSTCRSSGTKVSPGNCPANRRVLGAPTDGTPPLRSKEQRTEARTQRPTAPQWKEPRNVNGDGDGDGDGDGKEIGHLVVDNNGCSVKASAIHIENRRVVDLVSRICSAATTLERSKYPTRSCSDGSVTSPR
jgi:hypothetical protein